MTSAYSKSSISLGFNPISQKFCKIVCEIIFSRTVCGIFLIFCRSRFINSFVAKKKIFRNREITKSLISRDTFVLKKFPHTVLKILSLQISWKAFFSNENFWIDLELGRHFFARNNNFVLFSSVIKTML